MMNALAWVRRVQHVLDCRRFRGTRADYCDYLSALLSGMKGSRTLREIFAQDAARYGQKTCRGRLSSHWLQVYQASGGDLYVTWRHCFPDDELVVIRSAQAAGNSALVRVLAALSQAGMLAGRMRRIFSTALWSAAVAMVLLWCTLLAVPWWTAPRLVQAFAALPPEDYGRLTQGLLALARQVHNNWMIVMTLAVSGWAWCLWSLPNMVGRLRDWLDRYGCWRLYRHVHGLRLLALLAILLGDDDVAPTRLRSALNSLSLGASPWIASRLVAIRARVDAGQTGANSFDTGLLDRDQYWFLADMICARGLHAGLSLGSDRLRRQALDVAERQALALRWCLLLGVLLCILGLGLWHYAVIDEMRHALMLFYASQ